MTHVLTRKQTDAQGERHLKMESEIGVMHPQAKEHLELLEAGRDKEGSYQRNFRESMALSTP